MDKPRIKCIGTEYQYKGLGSNDLQRIIQEAVRDIQPGVITLKAMKRRLFKDIKGWEGK